MKKIFALLLALVMTMSLVACGGNAANDQQDGDAEGSKKIETLKVAFVPSREPEEIITVTEPLKQMLKDELAAQGYEVGDVEITVGTTYEAVGEGLEAGTIDVGLIPGGTYVLYDDGAEVILTATRAGLSNDSEDPRTWNGEANKTLKNGPQVTFYRSLIYATPSAYGKELAAKVNAGEELTWDDLSKANWAVLKNSSSAGYIYPTLWLQDHYEKKITDLPNVITLAGYGDAFAQAAAEAVDIIVCYADGRNDYEAALGLCPPVSPTKPARPAWAAPIPSGTS